MDPHDDFSLFGRDHLAALVSVALVGVLCCAAARRGGESHARGTRWLVAAALAAAHATEGVVAGWQGWYVRDMLPLQLCDVAAMLAVWGLLTLERRAIETLYFFALAGTLPALLTPELDVTFPDLRFVVYFVEHGLTVVAPLALVAGLGLRPRRGAWRRAVLQVNALAAVASLANRALGTNFLYLSRKPVGPTPFDLFGPWPNYLIVLEILVLVVFRLLQAVADFGRSPHDVVSRPVAQRDVRAGAPALRCARRTGGGDAAMIATAGPGPFGGLLDGSERDARGQRRRVSVLMAIVGIVQAVALALICLIPILLPERPPGPPDPLLTVLIYDPPPPPPLALPKGSPLRPEQREPVQPVIEKPAETPLVAPIEIVTPAPVAPIVPEAEALADEQFGSPTGSNGGSVLGMEGGDDNGALGGTPRPGCCGSRGRSTRTTPSSPRSRAPSSSRS